MRRILALSLVLNVTLVAGFLWQRSPVAHGGAVASANGDTNGDGTIDLSDAVYLLAWLFRDGPAPVPCPGGLGLPDTGQLGCFDCSGQPCGFLLPDSFLFSVDGRENTGCPNDANRFTVTLNANSEDVVTDNCTGLQWQRFTSETEFTWCDALNFCDDLRYAGRDDWRLPNVRELDSLVDYGRARPAIDPIFLIGGAGGGEADGSGAGGGPMNRFWSSTTDTSSPVSAWAVEFENGTSLSRLSKNNRFFVRAVRGGM